MVGRFKGEFIERRGDRTHEASSIKGDTKARDVSYLDEGREASAQSSVEVAFDGKGEDGVRSQQFERSSDRLEGTDFGDGIGTSRLEGNRDVTRSQIDKTLCVIVARRHNDYLASRVS